MGVQGLYAKPTTNAVATPAFLAAYEAKESRHAELQVSILLFAGVAEFSLPV